MCSLWGWRFGFLGEVLEGFGEGPELERGRSWFWGVAVAVPVLGLGGYLLQQAIANRAGWAGVAIAAAALSVGAALHCYYVWAPSPRWFVLGMLATRLCLLVLVGSLVVLGVVTFL